MDMRELLLEVEVVMSAVLEWNGVAGWQVSDDNPLVSHPRPPRSP